MRLRAPRQPAKSVGSHAARRPDLRRAARRPALRGAGIGVTMRAISGRNALNQTVAPVLRMGVLGAANIARQFIAGVRGSALVAVECVASRDAAKGRDFAAETGVARSCASYEALLADPAIDAVYNPLPNSLHAEWSIRAAEAGKHVLCEKPLAVTEAEARAMFAAAAAHGVILREAYPYMAQPQTVTMRRLLREGAIGRVQFVQAAIGFSLAAGPNVRLEPELGGGAVLDAGSYPVSLVRIAAGERPIRAAATARFYEPERGSHAHRHAGIPRRRARPDRLLLHRRQPSPRGDRGR